MGRWHQYIKICKSGNEEDSYQSERLSINYWKAYTDLQNKKEEYRNGQELWLKVEKDQEQHKKTINWIKGRAVILHKSNITYWRRAVLQPKNKQKSVGTIKQEIISKLILIVTVI